MNLLETINGIIQRGVAQFQGNNAGNAPVLLMLGGFKFSLNTAVFQTLDRDTSYNWGSIDRVGQRAALQWIGPGEDAIELPGVIYPDFRGGAAQLSDLRTLAMEGRPLKLISGGGEILGSWVIENVRETQSEHKPDGSFRRQKFSVRLKMYDDRGDV